VGGRGGAAGGHGGTPCPFPGGPSEATPGEPPWRGHGCTGIGPVASASASSQGGTDLPAADGGGPWSAHGGMPWPAADGALPWSAHGGMDRPDAHGGTAERTSWGSSHGGKDRPAAAEGRDSGPEGDALRPASQDGAELAGSGAAAALSPSHGGTLRASSAGGRAVSRTRSGTGADRAGLAGGLASSAPHGGAAWAPLRGGGVSSAESPGHPPGPAARATGEPVSSSGVVAGVSRPGVSALRPRLLAGAAPLPLAPLPALPLPGAPPFPVAPLPARLSASLARMAARAASPRAVSGTCTAAAPAGRGCS